MIEVLFSLAVLGGGALLLLAAIGVLRLPDVYARLQAGTKAASLGLALVFGGTAVVATGAVSVWKLVLAIALQFATAPVAAHVIGRAAYRSGAPMWEGTVIDELGRDAVPSDGNPACHRRLTPR